VSFMGTPNRISETKQTGVAYANTPHTSDIYSEAMYKIICGGWGGGQRLTRVGKSRRDIRLAEKSGHAGGGHPSRTSQRGAPFPYAQRTNLTLR